MLTVIDLATPGAARVTLFGGTTNDQSGRSVSNAGDVNGDSYDDFLIGANGADGTSHNPGYAYLIYGGPSMPATIDLIPFLPSSLGVTIVGANALDNLGISVSSANVNGDQYSDILIGANQGDGSNELSTNSGEVYVIYGGPSLPSQIDLFPSSNPPFLNGTNGITIYGPHFGSSFGVSVSGAGDMNGDSYDDVLVGAKSGFGSAGASNAGESFVIFGGPSLPAAIETSTLGAAGITIYGSDASDRSGVSVSGAGDVNGDGLDDLLIGADGGDALGNFKNNAGDSYVIFGSLLPPTTIDLSVPLGGAGITIFGATAQDFSGQSVSNVGDVNADGFADILIGAWQGDGAANAISNSGESYLIFGGSSLPGSIDLGSLGAGGVTIYGVDPNDLSGWSVSDAGDVNGDGFDDLLIGALEGASASNGRASAGETYVIYGKAVFPTTINLANPGSFVGASGFTILGADAGDSSGYSVSGAGDLNGDGYDDLLIGAPEANSVGNSRLGAGETYVIFGGNFSDIQVQSVIGNGNATLTVQYEIVNADLSGSFDLCFVKSDNRLFDPLDIPLSTVTISNAADLTVGVHSLVFTIGTGNQVQLPGAGAVGLGAETNLDYFILAVADCMDQIQETDLDPFNEDNTGVFIGAYRGDPINSSSPAAKIYLHGGALADSVVLTYPTLNTGNDVLTLGGSLSATYTYLHSNTTEYRLRTHELNDRVIVNNGSNTIVLARPMYEHGGPGNDTLNGASSFDTLFGGPADDSLLGSGNNDHLFGDDGNDMLFGGLGNDFLQGLAGMDTLNGDDGSDRLLGGLDRDMLFGNAGADILNGDGGNDILDGGADNDTLDGGADNDSLLGMAGFDSLKGNLGNDTLDGGTDNDTLSGDAGNDSLLGNVGNDILDGGIGNDNLLGGNDKDTLKGGLDHDTLNGGSGDDRLFGEAGNDRLKGDVGNDVLDGGSGNDSLEGEAGRDLLIGGIGLDTLRGGADDDILIGGTTAHDGIFFALNNIMAEWTNNGTNSPNTLAAYTARVNHLLGPVSGLNGGTFLKAAAPATVFDDLNVDLLDGGAGFDWFFKSLTDILAAGNPGSGEIVTLV